MKKTGSLLIVLMVLQIVGLGTAGGSDTWPTWRGPDLSGVSKQGHPPTTWGESQNVKYENRELTFTRTINRDGGPMDMAFTGTVGFDGLEGVFKSDRGEAAATGKLVGAALVGTWNLDLSSERGERKQRLRVNPDMSVLYGSTRIRKIDLDGENVSFQNSLAFGDQEFATRFSGKIAESKLTGELTTSGGTTKVAGTKRASRRRRPTQ